uniref:Methyltransferase domain-containing protein n=1 Tax=Candidatus Kentrum sp. SD TaxID=2126332 RepID=A0A450Y8L5_9GAMM|nr:MAG: hypothetical protein BECKSD772F_GA0070984_101828 [Candidatus Kentron sp. SD]VFK42504.1 MAG: hypothetical protein BECKSD772E_GA0070983_101728 [Candidatus Kentron sp. SD]VFK78159.1 MAG: hypothetical protein BECKSD772D_GA0070982_100826 [Candidatus Kentron sp. SD]
MNTKDSVDSNLSSKTSFDALYEAPTPMPYLQGMARLDYSIVDETAPFVAAAMGFPGLRGGSRVSILDVGSSYGVGGALMKYGHDFPSISAFFREASQHKDECVRQARHWLARRPPTRDLHYVGLDSSQPAIEFGVEAKLLDAGIAKNLESPVNELTASERVLIEECDLLVSTGAVGYLGRRTFQAILPHLGKSGDKGGHSPLALFTVLDIFDAEDVMATFHEHSFECRPLAGVSLNQRNFSDDREREDLLSLLDPESAAYATWSQRGKLCANLFIATPAAGFESFQAFMAAVVADRNRQN